MTKPYQSLALAGALAAGLSISAACSDPTKNIDGDGIMPANSLTSRLLGVEREYYCERNPAYHPLQSRLDEDKPWICDFLASVQKKEHRQVDAARNVVYVTYEPERFKHKVAKVMGTGIELVLASMLMGVGLYNARKKRRNKEGGDLIDEAEQLI